ncbi:hypothetical protein R1flu_014435 [Riccia fluitans]|uniref:Uncharacterized protein n=1 Tax=Riccia fluitans TaxID=41844 RepID=A0ABD1YG40_9MARC
MSGIRRRSRRQSDLPPEEPPSQCHRRATSLIYKLPHDEAMEIIDRLVQGEETNSGVGAIIEKFLTLQSMAIQPVVFTRLPRPSNVGFEELSLLTRDEVFPHLKFDHLKTEGILFIDGSLFARGVAHAQGQLPVNVSREGLKEYLHFPGSEDSSHVVSASVIEAEFLRCIGHKSLKDAWMTISFRLNHRNEDRASTAKFREGCQAVVWLLHTKFLAQMARQNQEGSLLQEDEPQNAFGDTQAPWDAERCELVCERDQLKEDLLKAQDVLADAAQWEEALRDMRFAADVALVLVVGRHFVGSF